MLCTKGFPGSKALLLEMVNKYCTALLCLSLLLSLYLNIKNLRKIVAFQNVILGCGLNHSWAEGASGKQNFWECKLQTKLWTAAFGWAVISRL